MQPLRTPALILLVLSSLLIAGCGEEDFDRVRADVEQRIEERIADARREFEKRRERYGKRIEEVLGDLEKAFERPAQTSPVVRSEGRNEPLTIHAFLTDVLENVDAFWTQTFERNGLPIPEVRYEWIPPRRVINLTACGIDANAAVAQYCPADDTIYIGQQFAADIYNGVARGFPGEASGHGRAAGDFAVAYIVAHEYAHNLQQELGIFDNRRTSGAKPFELQADCMSGVWAYSVFAAGDLKPGDIEEATAAALAVGDFETQSEQHHGTPDERREALLAGYRTGDPAACNRFLPA